MQNNKPHQKIGSNLEKHIIPGTFMHTHLNLKNITLQQDNMIKMNKRIRNMFKMFIISVY